MSAKAAVFHFTTVRPSLTQDAGMLALVLFHLILLCHLQNSSHGFCSDDTQRILLNSFTHVDVMFYRWPAFDDNIKGNVKESPDEDGSRVEILCAACDGYVFFIFSILINLILDFFIYFLRRCC